MISDSRRFTIGGQARIHTYGDQYNDSTVIKADIVHVRQALPVKKCREGRLEDDEYEQFREIIRGDLHSVRELRGLKELDLDKLHCQERKEPLRYNDPRTFHISKVRGEDGQFTVVHYHGEDAQEVTYTSLSSCGVY
ncbi:hypothetical protein VNI00_009013 [Paramarasmius palmivorus]|uniref:Uncharacterized protein n=1 Tax=Paramarasmius palmivorus TaxID=297713 RepID=A0AAW0CST7_9AGAR